MTVEERIQLRNELINKLINVGILQITKHNVYRFIKSSIVMKILDHNIELKNDYDLYVSQFRSKDEARYCLIHKDDFNNHICPICGKICEFYINKGRCAKYKTTCNDENCYSKRQSIIAASDKVQEKVKKTNNENHNCDYPTQDPAVVQKGKDTKRDRYGNENYNNSEKAAQTYFNEHGYTNPFLDPKVRLKSIITSLLKYGVDYPMKNADVQRRQRESLYKNHGVEYALQLPEIYAKFEDTMLTNHGVKHALELEEFIKKSQNTCSNHYNVNNYNQRNIQHYDIWSNDKKLKEYIIDQYNQKKKFLTLKEFAIYFNVNSYTVKNKVENLNLLEYFYIPDSNLEIDFKSFLESYNIQFIRRNKSLLYNEELKIRREIDFLINDDIGIEINDINTHNSMNSNWLTYKDPLYHQQKSLLAIEKNIRLIHLWEWELRNENEWSKISNWLVNELNQSKLSIDINQCYIVYVPKNIEQQFYNLYSIKEYQDSDVCMGLMYNNYLYQVISFKNINNQWNIINYGIVYNYTIDNGYKVLLDRFIQLYNIQDSLIIYLDISKEDLYLFSHLGFQLQNIIDPIIVWCDKSMNTSLIECENYVPIYNCGYAVCTYH